MNEQEQPVAPNKKTVRMMIILIILLLICIATRWGYVKREVTEAARGIFVKEAPADSTRK